MFLYLFIHVCLPKTTHGFSLPMMSLYYTFHLRFTCCPADCPELHRCPGDPGCVRGTGFLLGFQNRDGRESDALQLQVSAMSHEDWLYPG